MATHDLLTRAEAKRAIRKSEGDVDEDDILDVYITAASDFLDEQVGPTVARTVIGELHDGLNRAQTGYRTAIILRNRPILAIGTVTVDGTPLTQTTDYHADPYPLDETLFSGVLRRRWGNLAGPWDYGTANIVCTYTAGRVQATSNVTPRFKRAAAIVLENLWRDREAGVEEFGEFTVPRQSFPTFAMPRAASQLLTREMGFRETYGIGG